MSIFQIVSALLVMAGLASYINYRYLKMPTAIGLMAISLAVSLLLVLLGQLGLFDTDAVATLIHSVHFSETLLHGMLAFLLFAGALHVRLDNLKEQRLPIGVFATLGVLIATFAAGTLFWLAGEQLGYTIPYAYALLFGSLIAPTDPIAVLGILKKAGAPKSLETKLTGESLFNDGFGVVVFLSIAATATGGTEPEAGQIIGFLLMEALGGAALGLAAGWLTYRLLRVVDSYSVEVLLTLALAAGGYSLAELLHVSAPIAIVVAGLFIGNHGRSFAMSDETREHLDNFWELNDEIFNAVLFVLIGLEVLVLKLSGGYLLLGAISIVLVLAARYISIALPVTIMKRFRHFTPGAVAVLTWGGLRGGISVALALSLPPSPTRDVLLVVTYIVVVFSVLVQGLSLEGLIRRVAR